MKQVSNIYKNNVKKFGRQLDSVITYNDGSEDIEIRKPELNGVEYSYNGSILKSVMRELKFDVKNEIPVDTIVNFKFGVMVDIPNETYEYVDYGQFIVNKVTKKEDTNSYEILCYDKMLNAMKDYESFVSEYPITIRDYITNLARYIRLDFANEEDEFVNYDKLIQNELYLKEDGGTLGYTFRDVLDELAQVTASTICINEETNKLEIRYVPEPRESKNILDIADGFQLGYISTNNQYVADTKNALFNQHIEVESGTTYTFSVNQNVDNMVLSYYDDGDVFRGRQKQSNTNKITYTVASNVKYIRWAINYDNSTTFTSQLLASLQPMAEVGSERTSYEPHIIADTIDKSSLKDINVNFEKKYGPINSVVLSRSGGSDNIYLRDDESIEENGLCEIKISENQIMNFNDRDQYLPEILEKLNGFEYYLNDFSSTGITYLELCDRYNVEIDEETYPCIMLNDDINVTQGLEETIHADLLEQSQTNYTKADKTDRKINQTYIIADKQQGQIEALTSRTQTIENSMGDMYTIEQINQLLIDAQTGVTNTFSEAGGNNIFRNTGLWFENTGDDMNINPYEFWYGNVKKISEEKSANRNAMLLQNTTLSQTQVVPNGFYTISFKYKKLIPLSTVSVVINGSTINLDSSYDQEVLRTIEVNSQNIKIDFISDANDACEVYDFMVNAGKVRLAYSQNQNETTTDTVNISKGITITSSADENIVFKADYDGIRVYEKNNMSSPITYFTEKGMTTKEMVVEDKGEISGVLIQEIGNQTWFTKI